MVDYVTLEIGDLITDASGSIYEITDCLYEGGRPTAKAQRISVPNPRLLDCPTIEQIRNYALQNYGATRFYDCDINPPGGMPLFDMRGKGSVTRRGLPLPLFDECGTPKADVV